MNPKVSFVVPCYKLAHLLGECLESILSQTFTDFEVLIMDDCSPDNTGEVVASFNDSRIRYIRNDPNLGHLRNYNKGIELSRGEYVWLLSADDKLRRAGVLDGYVRVMDNNPAVGFACCAGMELRENGEEALAAYSSQADRDRIFAGRVFLKRLLKQNTVLASSGMVRKQCYERLGMFPTDMPYAGDWYLWCLFALHYDVAYFAEPLVSYRIHNLSMTKILSYTDPNLFVEDDLKVIWRLKKDAAVSGENATVKHCKLQIAQQYARAILSAGYQSSYGISARSMSLAAFEDSLHRFAHSAVEVKWIRAWVYAYIGDYYYQLRQHDQAREYYRRSLAMHHWIAKIWAKQALLCTGPAGILIRRGVFAVRKQYQNFGSPSTGDVGNNHSGKIVRSI